MHYMSIDDCFIYNEQNAPRQYAKHIALGWLSFAVGLGHSIFFIVNDLGRPSRNFTGYIALLIMLLVIAYVLVGIMLVHI
ncbi:hypothetical protein [Desulfosporosinus metallidurans]|uniref:hypothetical protein n=1 Tax=Desulfosporosinus metallidurans TaxID=1888891 RepID=UPI00094C1615|nr:hypothetical protein [Desulfosporosinus metallidurans]